MNKKGAITDMVIFLAISIVVVIFLGLFLYAFNQVSDVMTTLPGMVGNTTLSSIGEDTFGQVNNAFSTLRIISFVIIFGMILTIFLTNFLIRVHPMFFIVYFLVTILTVIASVPISNFYEESLLTDPVFGPTLLTFTGSNFIILNLPIIIAVVGLMGIIFLTLGIIKDREEIGEIV